MHGSLQVVRGERIYIASKRIFVITNKYMARNMKESGASGTDTICVSGQLHRRLRTYNNFAVLLGLVALPEPYMSVIVYVAVQIRIWYLYQKHLDSFIALRAMYLI